MTLIVSYFAVLGFLRCGGFFSLNRSTFSVPNIEAPVKRPHSSKIVSELLMEMAQYRSWLSCRCHLPGDHPCSRIPIPNDFDPVLSSPAIFISSELKIFLGYRLWLPPLV